MRASSSAECERAEFSVRVDLRCEVASDDAVQCASGVVKECQHVVAKT